jgi:hypothetical protein
MKTTFFPAAGAVLISVGGIFYLIWFPILSRDLFKLDKQN